jgi:hypothetical protein
VQASDEKRRVGGVFICLGARVRACVRACVCLHAYENWGGGGGATPTCTILSSIPGILQVAMHCGSFAMWLIMPLNAASTATKSSPSRGICAMMSGELKIGSRYLAWIWDGEGAESGAWSGRS